MGVGCTLSIGLRSFLPQSVCLPMWLVLPLGPVSCLFLSILWFHSFSLLSSYLLQQLWLHLVFLLHLVRFVSVFESVVVSGCVGKYKYG